MNDLSSVFAFLMGTILGGVIAWYCVKDKYAQISEEEIKSVKDAYAKKGENKAKEALKRYRGQNEESSKMKLTQESGVKDVDTTKIHSGCVEKVEPSIDDVRKIPYVISPEEFNELDGYAYASLTYFADGILSDELGVIIDNVEEIVGDALEHFGEYEDDSVFVRSDVKRCDYEILRDEREYAEFRKTLPPNI